MNINVFGATVNINYNYPPSTFKRETREQYPTMEFPIGCRTRKKRFDSIAIVSRKG
ncbi:hypothetical protein OROMI_015420 [Orobanche minor]